MISTQATPNNDDMSLASPEKPVAARHVADGVGINQNDVASMA